MKIKFLDVMKRTIYKIVLFFESDDEKRGSVACAGFILGLVSGLALVKGNFAATSIFSLVCVVAVAATALVVSGGEFNVTGLLGERFKDSLLDLDNETQDTDNIVSMTDEEDSGGRIP